MKSNLPILVDQDGVLANYDKLSREIILLERPEIYLPEEGHLIFPTAKNYPEAHETWVDELALREHFFNSLEPIEGAVEGMYAMLEAGLDVRICTAPKIHSDFCAQEKIQWIRRHLGSEFVKRTIITRDKTLVTGVVLIDDNPEIKGSQKPVWQQVLFDQPYNRSLALPRITWKNWREVIGAILN